VFTYDNTLYMHWFQYFEKKKILIKIYDMQDYISNQVTNFNLHAGHARRIDMT
jgi:hypothetical protein